MSNTRNTRSSQRTGIGETLAALTRHPSTPAPEASTSNLPSQASPTSEFLVTSSVPTDPASIDANNDPDEQDLSDHGDNDPKDPDPDQNVPAEQPDQQLARALELLADKIASIPEAQSSKRVVKPRVPDVFDGSDPNKLEIFTFQCSMYITACAKEFPDDNTRVTFAMSYLKGSPLDWFQTELSFAINRGGKFPTWFNSYRQFVAELQRLFGPRDPTTDAMNALEGLRYKDSSKATRYTIEFNRHARRTGWNEQALTRCYYKGLPDRLKDDIARVGKPTSLQSLQELISTLDQRYWERQSEVSRDKRSTSNQQSTSKSQNSTEGRSDNRSNNNHNSGGNKSDKQSNQNQQSQNKGKDQKKPANANVNASASSSSGAKPNSIANLLGPDGKLKPEERQRRMDNNLCLRCGQAGHTVNDCKVNFNKAKPKGRAATVTPANAAPAAGKA
jgi:hypothetical protein